MKNWLSSPVAINHLLSLCKTVPSLQSTYLQIYRELKIKKEYVSSNQLFLLPSKDAQEQYKTADINIRQFNKSKDVSEGITKWINQYGCFSQVNVEKYVWPTASSFLCNISVFKGTWSSNQSVNGPVMKVHNSFSYTGDINYEARLLELPMRDDDFKLAIIVPNEVGSVEALFSRLVEEGLDAAVSCVRPLFTFCTALESPSIEFTSEDRVSFSQNTCGIFTGAQVGNVKIDEAGTNISVLTLMNSSNIATANKSADVKESDTYRPYYFAVLYKNTAVFTGRYVKVVK